jgi:arginase family enzyme
MWMTYPNWEEIRKGHRFAGRDIPMLLPDMPSFMALPIARTKEELKGAGAAIIGAPYVANAGGMYSGVPATEWLAGPKRVRQQSARYPSGYVQDLDVDVFEHLKVMDFGDAAIPEETNYNPTAENILRAQAAVEAKVNDALDVGAVPIVIGQNSPCGSYAIAKPIAERAKGNVGMISFDTHWDSNPIDRLTKDPRIAGSSNWKAKTYELHPNFSVPNLVEIGERGMLERRAIVDSYRARGIHFYPMWRIRTELGIEGLCKEMRHAYEGTDAVYVHYDMDVLGGAGPAPGDILGDLAEPIGMTDYEVIRCALEIGKRGFTGASFICIPPGSAVVYRTIAYVIMFMLAGMVLKKLGRA